MSTVLTEAKFVELCSGGSASSPIEHGKNIVRKLMNPSQAQEETSVAYRVVLTNGTRATDKSEVNYAELEPSS